MSQVTGTLYGIGVGPGDPELLTIKAHRLIQQCDVLTYIINSRGHSMARNIASKSIDEVVINNPDRLESPIQMPMCEDRKTANEVYDDAGVMIDSYLSAGKNVVFLCEGDPLFFGSFAYLHDRLANLHAIEIVPGITSINAAAALTGTALGLLAENIAIISGRRQDEDILQTLQQFDNIAIMKPGRRRPDIIRLIKQAGRANETCYAEYIGHETERVVRDISALDDEPGPYFAVFMVNRHRDYR